MIHGYHPCFRLKNWLLIGNVLKSSSLMRAQNMGGGHCGSHPPARMELIANQMDGSVKQLLRRTLETVRQSTGGV
jgi:hypothetical protein